MTAPTIVYEDGEALVIDKPAGLSIERPRKGGASLEDYLEDLKLGFQRPPVAVHRLDTDTSGCLLLARNPKALKRFNRAFEERQVAKSYIGLVAGELTEDDGTIELALAKVSSAERGWRMIAAKKGKPSITHWERIGRGESAAGPFSIVRFRPVTGRTHQIRIHALAGLGAALLGDPVYGTTGGSGKDAPRTMLHAESLEVTHEGKTPILARAPLPADFTALGVAV
ncbi:RluA family pseudouridine synthase [Alteriqipengyuania sp. WL0013]|uniref:RluA family pseudouridine synthase n=1 Tax=Alteriqipengyuania sp. WL0013 TaxID=3110773 RepID=UPI002B558A28|nr:RluA family pseudouridine synthase [Alteriqipengyuania sp. WL0013]MEB3416116.1 RluA family pseudouridine synthase [Alteriqipengyuania sp. WL0013]